MGVDEDPIHVLIEDMSIWPPTLTSYAPIAEVEDSRRGTASYSFVSRGDVVTQDHIGSSLSRRCAAATGINVEVAGCDSADHEGFGGLIIFVQMKEAYEKSDEAARA